MDTQTSPMDLIGNDVLARVAAFLPLEDLLRFTRLSKRHHDIVLRDSLGEAAWQHLYLSHFGGVPDGTAAQRLPEAATWRARFKARFVEASAQERLRRAARRHKCESRLQALDLEVHRLRAALARERRTLGALEAEAAALAQARAAAESQRLAQLYWQPVAVARAQGVVTEQSEPMDAESRSLDLTQRVAVSRLELRKLEAQVEGQERRRGEARCRLASLQP